MKNCIENCDLFSRPVFKSDIYKSYIEYKILAGQLKQQSCSVTGFMTDSRTKVCSLQVRSSWIQCSSTVSEWNYQLWFTVLARRTAHFQARQRELINSNFCSKSQSLHNPITFCNFLLRYVLQHAIFCACLPFQNLLLLALTYFKRLCAIITFLSKYTLSLGHLVCFF